MLDGSPSNPPIRDYINKGDKSSIGNICAYLDGGLPLIVTPGVAVDIIDENKGIAGSPPVLTDGRWEWSGVLSYYVRNYNLKLSSAFIETMKSNDWRIPIREDELDYSSILLDGNPL